MNKSFGHRVIKNIIGNYVVSWKHETRPGGRNITIANKSKIVNKCDAEIFADKHNIKITERKS